MEDEAGKKVLKLDPIADELPAKAKRFGKGRGKAEAEGVDEVEDNETYDDDEPEAPDMPAEGDGEFAVRAPKRPVTAPKVPRKPS